MKTSTKKLSRVPCPRAFVIAFVVLAVCTIGCTTVPTPVRLINKPMSCSVGESKEQSVCLIVRDERPELIQKVNMSGVTRTTIFMIPTSFAFLGHMEHLDSIVSHHLKKAIERNGYTVAKCYPAAPDELSAKELERRDISKADSKAAWKLRKTQDDKKSRGRKAKKKQSVLEDLDETVISAWGVNVDTSGCDAVIEVKIRKFWTDYGYFGSFSWMSCNIALCDPEDAQRKVLFGKKARRFGYCFSLFTPLTPGGDIPVSMNTSSWFVVNSFQNILESTEFCEEMARL